MRQISVTLNEKDVFDLKTLVYEIEQARRYGDHEYEDKCLLRVYDIVKKYFSEEKKQDE